MIFNSSQSNVFETAKTVNIGVWLAFILAEISGFLVMYLYVHVKKFSDFYLIEKSGNELLYMV